MVIAMSYYFIVSHQHQFSFTR